jgi:hypothetical protein
VCAPALVRGSAVPAWLPPLIVRALTPPTSPPRPPLNLRRHKEQRRAIAEARDAVSSAVEDRLVQPFELWLRVYNAAKVRP